MSEDWTEKYRPDTLAGIIGNPKAVADLTSWARSWNNGIPEKRAVVLRGDPGIGKTSAAVALANDMKWDLVEMNASDQRTGDAIRNVALKGAKFNTFSDNGSYMNAGEGGRKLIVLDEADNLFGREDRGALPVISELIKNTRQPVILIVNDFYELSKKSAVIKSNTLQITFMRPRVTEIMKTLAKIAKNENVSVNEEALKKIAENSNGDMRAALRNLESLSFGRSSVTENDATELSERILKKDIHTLLNAIFREKDAMNARSIMQNIDETPDHKMLWIDENIPYALRDKGDLTRGYEKLARADIFLGRVRRRQYYRFWAYAGDIMSAGVNVSIRSAPGPYERYRFPMYLSKMARSKGVRAMKKGICLKLSAILHTSTSRISDDVLPMLKVMLKNDPELAKAIADTIGAEAEEMAFLLDAKVDSDIVKSIVTPAKVNAKKPDIIERQEEERDAPDEKSEVIKKEPPGTQKSLFQF